MLSYFTNYAVYLACMCLPSEPKITGFQSKHNILSIFRNFFIYIHKTTSLHIAVFHLQIFIYTYLCLIDIDPIPYWYWIALVYRDFGGNRTSPNYPNAHKEIALTFDYGQLWVSYVTMTLVTFQGSYLPTYVVLFTKNSYCLCLSSNNCVLSFFNFHNFWSKNCWWGTVFRNWPKLLLN